jgi:D-alanyl-D-alanine dipeptidase
MKAWLRALAAGLILVGCGSAGPERQALIVAAEGWDSPSGLLWRAEQRGGQWRLLEGPQPAWLGMRGLAWGRGLRDYRKEGGPAKREGDRRTPAGIFRLGPAFGYAPQAPGLRMPYLALDSSSLCVDDPASPDYNQLLNEAGLRAPAASAERMGEVGPQYAWGLVVQHNSDPPEAGAGSCIFLHIRNPQGGGTLGCTALEAPAVEEILRWLDPAAQPLLIQAPAQEMEGLMQQAGLNIPPPPTIFPP